MTVKFLADESCDFAVVRALKAASFEVVTVSEMAPGSPDADVIKLALKFNCILLTEDRDFGELVFAHQQNHGGIILIRFPSAYRDLMTAVICKLVQDKGEDLAGCFIVVSPSKIRINKKL